MRLAVGPDSIDLTYIDQRATDIRDSLGLVGVADHAAQAGASRGQVVLQVGDLRGKLLAPCGEFAVEVVEALVVAGESVAGRNISPITGPGSVVSVIGFVKEVVLDVALGLKLSVQFRLVDKVVAVQDQLTGGATEVVGADS